MPPVSPRRLLPIAAASLALAPSAAAAPHTLVVGAAEATSQVPDLATAKAKMDLAQLAGLGAIRLAATWPAGQTQPDQDALVGLKNAVAAADLDAIQTIVALDHGGANFTPTTPLARAQYAAWAANLARELKTAFRGTAQPGAKLPIVYAEYGIQTQIPSDKLSAYTDLGALGAFDAVPEAVQGAYYPKAIRMAFCQPTVRTLLFFHVSDEADLDRWQSGLFYADDTPKSDLPTVKLAVNAARAGTLTCKRFPAKTRRQHL